jgi:hypothetical protein
MTNNRSTPLLISLLTLASLSSLAQLHKVDSEIKNYPLIMWSYNSDQTTQEIDTSIGSAEVFEAIKNQADASQAELVVVLLKEKLSTPKLVSNAASLSYIKTQVLSHATVYINVEESISAEQL